jgi:hypothetical protein
MPRYFGSGTAVVVANPADCPGTPVPGCPEPTVTR